MARPPPLRVKDVMTRHAYKVRPSDSLLAAKELMQFHGVRHLPVVEGERIVGILSLGDLYAMESLYEVDPEVADVASAMAQDPYMADGETPLAAVVREMARRHIGSTIITKHEQLAGIFTASDACRLLGDLLAGGPFA